MGRDHGITIGIGKSGRFKVEGRYPIGTFNLQPATCNV
jgi:hypothetical protein